MATLNGLYLIDIRVKNAFYNEGGNDMKFACQTIKYNKGVYFIGASIGCDTKKIDRHLRLQLDLLKYAVVFTIRRRAK